MDKGNIVVNYAHIQEAFDRNPDEFQQSVYQSADKAANGDASERAQFIARWNEGLAALKDEKPVAGVMSAPRNGLASRVQTLLATQAAQVGKLSPVRQAQSILASSGAPSTVPMVEEVKFDSDDLLGWLGMAWKFIFKPDVHPWITPPAAPETIADDARIAVFSDWGTGLYGAPVIAKSIVRLDRCDVVLH